MLPEIGTIIAVFELHHSAKANELRIERNELADTNNSLAAANNKLAEENNELQRQFQAERNEHLAEIARQMHRPQTAAERNASKLREHLGSPVLVLNNDNSRAGTPQIAEVSDGNIVALFQPMQHGSRASVIYADCEDVELIEIAQGACPLQVKVNKRYGSPVQLGEITKWEDRGTPAAIPAFERGGTAYYAQFRKPGSAETRRLLVYTSKDGANSFQLEASTGEQFVGDNKAVSIRFLSKQVEYLADGFLHNGDGTGETKYPLFLS
jgi:predicted transcriptional regulator